MANGMLVLPRKLWSLQPTVDTTMSMRAWRAFGVWTTGKLWRRSSCKAAELGVVEWVVEGCGCGCGPGAQRAGTL